MSTPNMSGRTDAPTTTDGVEHRDPSEFLGDDGTFDVASAKRVSNQSIRPDDCADLRRRVRGETDVSAIDTDWSDTAVRRHVRGRCSCPVTVPTLAYDKVAGRWRADE
jgi:hypothetical protein